jgi:galactofuranosylgalactofuranosylrhamnosyl-N-acetylglucosaminyl-diphospho-decaprenol beta-1,5/1,6-galactofuranosyltransferase
VTVFRARPGTGPQWVSTIALEGDGEIDLPADGVRWYWIEMSGGGRRARLESMRWSVSGSHMAQEIAPTQTDARRADGDPRSVQPASGERFAVTAVVPSFGREQDAIGQVRRLLATSGDVVARVVLVDQGRTIRSAPGAAEMIAEAGDRLLLVEQDNLGGSGGYARGMLESLAFPADAVLLLDDDALLDPEGLRRMAALSALAVAAGSPTIVGTPLLAAEQPTELVALAEAVRWRDFRWGPSDGLTGAVDVGLTNPAGWSFADPDACTGYSGWWGTLLPPGAVAEIGLPAPYFLKWDDAEYGLRARRTGYRVATVPGTGAWHPTWSAKRTISSWAAWPLHRNRMATAAAYRAGPGVLADSLVHQIKHVLSLQYGTADLWDAGLAQFLSGPGWLTGDLRATRARAQAVLDAEPARQVPAGRTYTERPVTEPPTGPAARLLARSGRVMRAVTGLVRRASARDVVHVTPAQFTWRTGIGRDVGVLEGTGRTLVRNPSRARAALSRTVRLHLRAASRWPALRRAYARALPASSTVERWRAVIAGGGDRRL